MHKLTKKFFKLAVSPNLAFQHVKEAFPDMQSSPILPHKFPRADAKLTLLYTHMSSKVKHQIRDKFAIK